MLLASAALFGAACGGAEIGEACETEGSEDECVDGAVCAQPTLDSTEPQCLKICTDDAQCASTESCNGVSGTNIKACRPK
ncbi:hypothetical protein E8A73_035940 [Polyangium aurulentum]|nr:hypothetical protein E8A73_035940 [Polyangium aurulentum]